MKWLVALLALSFISFIPVVAHADGVFCEYLTTTDCHACPAVSEMLYELHNSNEHFYFVSMIADKNEDAMNRSQSYNVYGYPTAFFDGGYVVVFGKNDKSKYIDAINECMQREKTLDINLKAKWNENGVSIDATLTSSKKYDGLLKIYVVEPVSRWKDDAGKPFHFGFIGYAYNNDISVDGSREVHAFWNAPYTENIMFIAVAFSHEYEIRYSDPPANNHAFKAHFVDGMAVAVPSPDTPPSIKLINKPSHIHGYRNVSFEWNGSDDNSIPKYSYRLSGESWHEWGDETKAYYVLPDGKYTFYVRAKDNLGQVTSISCSFIVDTSKPFVVFTSPSNNAVNVPVYKDIVIRFSHPMDRKASISITPPAGYRLWWNGDEELHIKASLKYETRYVLTIDAARPSGQKLHYSLSFTTAPPDTSKPVVLEAEPFYDECYGTIKIKFSKPMDRNIMHGISITPWIPFVYSWEDNDTMLVIKPMNFTIGNYTVHLNNEITDKYGNPLDNYTFSFYITRPRILFTSFENVTLLRHDTLIIKFSHHMNRTSVESALSIYGGNYSITWEDNRTIEITGTWRCGKNTIVIDKAKDIRGIEMDNTSMNFLVPCYTSFNENRSTPSFTFSIFLVSIIASYFIMRRR